MKALLFERSLPRFAAARVGGHRLGPLRLAEVEEPALPGPQWHRVAPRLAGICGSDLATVNGRSSRWFEPVVSFPFVPGHEVVADLEDGSRAVLSAVLHCAIRAIEPPCDGCAAGETNRCRHIAFGHLAAGLQTGYCADTGGGWSQHFVAHDAQLHPVPEGMSDEAAVMVEPAACALQAEHPADEVVVLGAGTLGLCTVAALTYRRPRAHLIVAAKHPTQRRFAADLGATQVVDPGEVERAVRRAVGSQRIGGQVAGGIHTVIDCVGSADSLAQALRIVAPGGTVVLVGMPGPVRVDLTPLWQREVSLRGAYAYTTETFRDALDLVATARLERLVSARYPLERWREAIDHANHAGARGAVKIVFDMRKER